MQIFIANINSISKNPDTFAALLSNQDRARVAQFSNQTRKLQFILGHLIADNCGVAHTCIAHKDKFVVVAADADCAVGIDIENASLPRDFVAIAKMMNFGDIKSLSDFYKAFTESEAVYKLGTKPKCTCFMDYGDHLICVVSNQNFEMPTLTDFDVESLLLSK